MSKPILLFILALIVAILVFPACRADVSWASAKPQITVLVIDTGFDQTHEAFAGFTFSCPEPQDCVDIQGHGTHVMSLVVGGEYIKKKPTSKVCNRVIIYSCDYEPLMLSYRHDYCLRLAADLRPDFVNYSSSGPSPSVDEYEIIKETDTTKWIVATGNQGEDLFESPLFPAMYTHTERLKGEWVKRASLKNIIPVGALTHDGTRYALSGIIAGQMWELGVNVQGAGPYGSYVLKSGTSMATAIHTHKLIMEKCNE